MAWLSHIKSCRDVGKCGLRDDSIPVARRSPTWLATRQLRNSLGPCPIFVSFSAPAFAESLAAGRRVRLLTPCAGRTAGRPIALFRPHLVPELGGAHGFATGTLLSCGATRCLCGKTVVNGISSRLDWLQAFCTHPTQTTIAAMAS